jgi:chromosome segregation ATPase
MANENNKINNLVTTDDDPTAELEIPAFAQLEFDAEADGRTYNPEEHGDHDQSADLNVSKLESDLRSRKKIIGRLQFDIEQLHAKWLGLEAEIGARESQTVQINKELSSSQEANARKDKLIKKRDRKIKGLKTEIRQRDENYRQLKNRLDDLLFTVAEEDPAIEPDSVQVTNDLTLRLRRTEEYADLIRQQMHDLLENNTHAEKEIDSLSHRLADVTERNAEITEGISSATSEVEELQSTLDVVQKQHEEKIRILRFELGSAQSTVFQAEELNSQMASDLIDARSFKDELEKMLGDAEEQSSERTEQLEKEVSKLTAKADSFEQKLTARSEAISILLAELAKKPEPLDPVGEIEEVIQDINGQMSERSSRTDPAKQGVSGDRISRVLIGTVDDQMLRFPLFKDHLTIGRTKDNDIQLKAVYVSRRHAVIQTDGDLTRIIDWGSKNGIQVNSATVSEHFLCHGDTVVIGNARFRYEERRKRDSQ